LIQYRYLRMVSCPRPFAPVNLSADVVLACQDIGGAFPPSSFHSATHACCRIFPVHCLRGVSPAFLHPARPLSSLRLSVIPWVGSALFSGHPYFYESTCALASRVRCTQCYMSRRQASSLPASPALASPGSTFTSTRHATHG
jgi:hypothetical protein